MARDKENAKQVRAVDLLGELERAAQRGARDAPSNIKQALGEKADAVAKRRRELADAQAAHAAAMDEIEEQRLTQLEEVRSDRAHREPQLLGQIAELRGKLGDTHATIAAPMPPDVDPPRPTKG